MKVQTAATILETGSNKSPDSAISQSQELLNRKEMRNRSWKFKALTKL